MDQSKPKTELVVVGAGVIGLQTALSLLEEGVGVTIISRDWPGDSHPLYTSMWAGAQWRSTSLIDDHRTQNWARQTFDYWVHLSKRLPAEHTGVHIRKARYLWDQAARRGSPEEWIWWTKFPPSCKLIPKVMLPSISDDVAGLSFDAFSIAPSKYLKYLLEANLASGAKCITKDLQSISDVFSLPEFDNIHGVINCTGIGAVSLVHDPSLYPTKGQSIIVRGEAECVTTMTGDGWEAVVVPRCGEQETFLGVSKVADSWDSKPDEEVTQTILRRCRLLAPELLTAENDFDVLRVQVGLRPSRLGGPRVELELLDGIDEHGTKYLYHHYGHAGSGFEESFGSAKSVVRLVMETVNQSSISKVEC